MNKLKELIKEVERLKISMKIIKNCVSCDSKFQGIRKTVEAVDKYMITAFNEVIGGYEDWQKLKELLEVNKEQ